MIIDKNYKEAIIYFTKTINNNPKLKDAYLNRGIANVFLGNFDISIPDFEMFDSLSKDDYNFEKQYLYKSIAYINIGDTTNCQAYIIEGMDSIPNKSVEIFLQFKALCTNNNLYKCGITICDSLSILQPTNDVHLVDKGNFHLLLRDTVNAISSWEKAFEIYPQNYGIGQTLYSYFLDKGDIDKAIYYKSKAERYKRNN